MAKPEGQYHVGRDRTVRQCVAEIQCPLAHPLAHFTKKEEAVRFNDELNEAYQRGKEEIVLKEAKFPKWVEPKEMTNPELLAVRDIIDEEKANHDDYTDYYNPARWQKTQRNKARKKMINLTNENDEWIKLVEDAHTILVNARVRRKEHLLVIGEGVSKGEITNEDAKARRHQLNDDIRRARTSFQKVILEASNHTVKNETDYEKQLDKKKKHEEKLVNFLKKRKINQAIITMREEIEFELEDRT